MTSPLDFWASLNHGGLLVAPAQLTEYFSVPPAPLPIWQADKLRRVLTAFDGSNERLTELLDHVLQDLSGLPAIEWHKAQDVDASWGVRSFTGALVKPRRLWHGPKNELLPLFVPEDGASRQFAGRLGVGRSRQLLSRVVEWLRHKQLPLALVTNGRQWRLVHAGQDYEAWCEWDIDLWFEEGQPGMQVKAWRQMLGREALLAAPTDDNGLLQKAILASRKGQADLSAVLGERVRQAVEELITASHGAIEQVQKTGQAPAFSDLYVAGSRIVMRAIITMFAEARGLLPLNNVIYHGAYSLDGLRQSLDRRASGRGNERLSQGRSAWPRLMALFGLIYHGSSHEALPVPQYSGALFQPGDTQSLDGVSRALALLESSSNAISDRQVQVMLRLLTRTKMKVRQGRKNTLVDVPVDFSALSSEYIGILYEGLLDFELKQAGAADPVIFLAVGDEPALTLTQLESMDDAGIKQLFEALKSKSKPALSDDVGSAETEDADGSEDAGDEEETGETAELDEADASDDAEVGAMEDLTVAGTTDDELAISADHLTRAQAWLERAALAAGLVKKPRTGHTADAAAKEEAAQALARAAKSLCARLVAPGQFFLVRWGGTRKGAGTFYTRPQLATPTVHRTLQPLAYEPVRSAVDVRSGLENVVEWAPKRPEVILALKVCDPAMGSGSFLASALRFLTNALWHSLHHHKLIERAEDGGVPRMVDGQISELLSDELLKLNPAHEGFEEALRAQLKRHIVERCLYGVDLDPLAVELGRMALWVETMDRDLPFGFLDHKLKVGNALVGAWFDTYRDYPALAWEREGGDKDYQKDKPQNLVNHFFTDLKGKRRGDKFTAAINARAKAVPEQLAQQLAGQVNIGATLEATDTHKELLKVFAALHRLPVHESDKRAALYQDKVLNNPHYHALKARMDLWCALWFWPGEQIELAPLPIEFSKPSDMVLEQASALSRLRRFFHWELEFPDVFTATQQGFDCVLGNPPWEIQKPNSKEFFSNHDPLYRAYGKQEALTKQLVYFRSLPGLEQDWVAYNAGLKAMSNWIKCVGQPFGDRVTTDKDGKKKHDLNLGGRGRDNYVASVRLHKKWQLQRAKHKGFADARHPFLHQGSADLNTYKMFLELSQALLRPNGRMGMIVPSGIYTDKGTTSLRELFLDQCDWQWLFGFENSQGIFDIHKSYKFCPMIVKKGGRTESIRTAFMRSDVDDWSQAENFVQSYPRERVIEFSPFSRTILEIRGNEDLRVLKKIYANAVLLADQSSNGWGVMYAREFDMTNDSKLFPPLPKWEQKGYVADEHGYWLEGPWRPYSGPNGILDRPPGIVLSRDGAQAMPVDEIGHVALVTYNAKMFELWDHSASGWVSGKGRGAIWADVGYPKVLKPEYLMAIADYATNIDRRASGKICFKDISTAIHQRTMMSSLMPDLPAVNASPVLTCSSNCEIELLQAVLGSFVFDYVAKFKIGYLHLNYFIIEECPLVRPERLAPVRTAISAIALRLGCPSELFAPLWLERAEWHKTRGWRAGWAITPHERTRLKAKLDACMAHLFGLDIEDFRWLLLETDHPEIFLAKKRNTKSLDQKRFWRIDKQRDPELRHSVLALVAFHDLQSQGIDHFLSQNNGEGWLIPETIRLADYGLGHDDRAQHAQPVAARLGPRFLDWQLNEDVDRSWQECAAHAALICRIVPVHDSIATAIAPLPLISINAQESLF